MDQPDMPVVRFYRLIDEARFPQRADRSAAGTLPTRAYRYCQPATSAAGFGWWVFPPADLQFLWDGHDIFWQRTGGADWLPLAPQRSFLTSPPASMQQHPNPLRAVRHPS